MEKTERTVYFDLLRVLATLGVVMLHVAAGEWGKSEGADWQMLNLYDGLVRWTVPVFVMISGALFLGRDIPIRRMVTKYILRIVLAYLLWSALYALVDRLAGQGGSPLYALVAGHYHMWFLPMIVGLYLAAPLLRKITESPALTKYFLLLFLIFGCLIPTVRNLLALGSGRVEAAAKAAGGVIDNLNFHVAVSYGGYFVLGWALNRADLSRRAAGAVYALGALGLAGTVGLTAWLSAWAGEATGTFYGNFTPNVLAAAAAIFLFFRRHGNLASPRLTRVLAVLSKWSFGAYLSHALVIEQLGRWGLDTQSLRPAISVPLITLIAGAGAFAISGILNQIPGIRRYFV